MYDCKKVILSIKLKLLFSLKNDNVIIEKYCGLSDFVMAQFSWNSLILLIHRMTFLHELINYGYKVISSFVDIKEYTKLCPQEFV